MFIRISNPAEEVNRVFLEKLGISTKRDDDSVIGQFGSGVKLAPIAALRNDWRWIFTGKDVKGEYTLEYIKKKEDDGFEHIYYDYGDVVKSSSFTLDAGVLSWNDDFQIFREAFANALDEGEYEIDYADEIENIPGKFCVYLTAAHELKEIVSNIDRWFTINRDPIYEGLNGSIFEKHGTNTRIYAKKVFVWEPDIEQGLFDYQIDSTVLNEERRVKSEWSLKASVGKIFDTLTSDKAGLNIAKKMIKNMNFDFFEMSLDSYHARSGSTVWADAWREIHGKNGIPVSAEEYDACRASLLTFGFNPVLVKSKFIYALLECAKVKTPMDVLGEGSKYQKVAMATWQRKLLNEAVEYVRWSFPRIDDVEIQIFRPGVNQTLLGVHINGTNEVLISEECLNGGINLLVGTLIHELDHFVTGYRDETMEFRNVADNHIARLTIENYRLSNPEVVKEVG